MTKKFVLRLVAVLAVLGAVLLLAVWLLAGMVIHYTPPTARLQPADFDRIAAGVPGGVQKVHLVSSDGVKTVGWFLAAPLPAGAEHWGIVLSHGGGDDKRFYLPLAIELRQKGYDVYLPDLRGSGESDPSPHGTTLGITESRDVAAAAAFLADQAHVQHIAAGGVSMGSQATLMAAAAEPRIGPLIIESGSYQAQTVFDTLLAAFHLPSGRFRWGLSHLLASVGLWRMQAPLRDAIHADLPTLRLASTLAPRPVIFVYGSDDPFVHADAVNKLSLRFVQRPEVVVFPHTGHGVYPRHPKEYTELVTGFLQDWRK